MILCVSFSCCNKHQVNRSRTVIYTTNGVISSDTCAKFNAKDYLYEGVLVYVAPYPEGYIILCENKSDEDGLFEFVSSRL